MSGQNRMPAEATARVNHLLACAAAIAPVSLQYSRVYVNEALGVSESLKAPLPTSVLQHICQQCACLLIPGLTSKTRLVSHTAPATLRIATAQGHSYMKSFESGGGGSSSNPQSPAKATPAQRWKKKQALVKGYQAQWLSTTVNALRVSCAHCGAAEARRFAGATRQTKQNLNLCNLAMPFSRAAETQNDTSDKRKGKSAAGKSSSVLNDSFNLLGSGNKHSSSSSSKRKGKSAAGKSSSVLNDSFNLLGSGNKHKSRSKKRKHQAAASPRAMSPVPFELSGARASHKKKKTHR
jgi:RNase P subunit RPR2